LAAGLCRDPVGSLQRTPDLLAGLRWKKGEGKGGKGKAKESEGKDGKKEGGERKGREAEGKGENGGRCLPRFRFMATPVLLKSG